MYLMNASRIVSFEELFYYTHDVDDRTIPIV